MAERELSYLNDEERLKAYQTITTGCSHLWSKNKLVESRLDPILDTFVTLAEKDPYFLAQFTSYAIKKLPSKDLKVVATFANSLSDADGTPFSPGSKYKKPNLRVVSQAALLTLDPKLVRRVIKLANRKIKLGSKSEGSHFSKSLRTAVKKYLKYREANPKALEGIRKVGFSNTVKNIYRDVKLAPSKEAAGLLKWKQKDGRDIKIKKDIFDFTGLSDLQIAEKIRKEKLPPTGVLGALPDKLSPVIAASVLEQASGDQAVILSEMFEKQGLLKNNAVKEVYAEKLKTAKTALDRVERIKKDLDEDVKKTLKSAKADKRKSDMAGIGRVFVHIDISSSMYEALEVAKESGAIIAECVPSPGANFHWGVFNERGRVLPAPRSFEKDAFMHALYGVRSGGCTDCLALYKEARRRGCDVDIYITDQGHNGKDMNKTIRDCSSKPKAAVIVNVGRYTANYLKDALERNGIPVAEVKPSSLKESALVTQAVKTAMLGANAILDDIMSEPLLELPKWWCSV